MRAEGWASLIFVAASIAADTLAAVVRPPAVAGSWYAEDRAIVVAEIDQYSRDAAAAPVVRGRPIALVVPHAGWRFSGVAVAAAFRGLRPGDFSRVVVVAPSHHVGFRGFAVSDFAAYRTPLGDVPVDREACAALREGGAARHLPGGEDPEHPEHAVEIELPFLQLALGGFRLVPILAGEATAEMQRALAARLAALNDGATLFVFSTDFTHYGSGYGYTPFGASAIAARARIRAQAERAIDSLVRADAAGFRAHLERTGDTICGRAGLGVLLELLPRIAPKARGSLLARYASIDVPGFRDENSVTYVALAYAAEKAEGAPLESLPSRPSAPVEGPPIDVALGARLVALARSAIRSQLDETADLRRDLAALPRRAEMDRLQGVFVTLNRTDPVEIAAEGRLRGCIGQVLPTYPLRRAVVEAAVDAAIHDSRFAPVEKEELPRLAVEVTVLSPPRPVESWKEIRLGRDGIVLEKAGRRALFLPQVPGEQGWSLSETLTHLARKAGLPGDAWREGARFAVFTGQVFHESSDESPGR